MECKWYSCGDTEGFFKKNKPTILGIQEIKIDSKSRAAIEFDFGGYHEYWNPAERPGYSGTATLVRESYQKPISVTNGFGAIEFDSEGRVQILEFEKFYFVNSYFPNANHELSRLDYKLRFNASFIKLIQRLDKKKPVIACGDYNVAHKEMDLKNPKSNKGTAGFTKEERSGMDIFIKKNFVDTYRHFHPDRIQYTWWTYRFSARERNVGWRIDYFLVSKRFLPKIGSVHINDDIFGSDHCPITIEVKLP